MARRGGNTAVPALSTCFETKDIMQEQLDACETPKEPDAAKHKPYLLYATPVGAGGEKSETTPAVVETAALSAAIGEERSETESPRDEVNCALYFSRLKANEVDLLEEELGVWLL